VVQGHVRQSLVRKSNTGIEEAAVQEILLAKRGNHPKTVPEITSDFVAK
jgi:hypothetical protein